VSDQTSRSWAPPATRQSGLRALVVEDETPLAPLLGNYLERDGFDVSVVHDGLKAVEIARIFDPDVVVLDLGLPGLDGVEVCRQLRTFSNAYVVMLTARSDEISVSRPPTPGSRERHPAWHSRHESTGQSQSDANC